MSAAQVQLHSVSLSSLLQSEFALPAGFERKLSGIQLDSRKIRKGDLFLACNGATVDGRSHIPAAIAGGAAAVLVEADAHWYKLQEESAVPVIPVTNLPGKLGRIAARFYGEPASKLRLIGITGTNGKTSCCHLIAACLTALGHQCGVIGTLGHGLSGTAMTADAGGPSTTPDAVRLQELFFKMQEQQADTVVMEVSSHALEQDRVSVDDFIAAVFTNLTRDHLDYHGSMHAYGAAKRRLFTGKRLQAALVNLDDPFASELLNALPPTVQAHTFSLHDATATVHANDLQFTPGGMQLAVTTPWGKGVISSKLFGSFNASNLLAVLSTVLACEQAQPGFSAANIMDQVGQLAPIRGRMELLDGFPLAVVVDYAHTPDGLESALRALREHFKGRIHCVFGCGGERDAGKRPLMAQIAERMADVVTVTDDNPRKEDAQNIIAQILAGFLRPEKVQTEHDRARAIADAIAAAVPGDVVLIAGKGHEQYQETNGQRVAFSDVQQAQQYLQRRFP